MIEQMNLEISHLYPLEIHEAAYAEPSLTLSGTDWAFASVSSWRVIKDGVLSYAWSYRSAAEQIQSLRGASITSIIPQSRLMRGDPTLVLSTGEYLEIFADQPSDPWELAIPGLVYVGNPTDPRCAQ